MHFSLGKEWQERGVLAKNRDERERGAELGSEEGIPHPPGSLHEYERKRVAGKGVWMSIRTKEDRDWRSMREERVGARRTQRRVAPMDYKVNS